jgi:hypothetical protein
MLGSPSHFVGCLLGELGSRGLALGALSGGGFSFVNVTADGAYKLFHFEFLPKFYILIQTESLLRFVLNKEYHISDELARGFGKKAKILIFVYRTASKTVQ